MKRRDFIAAGMTAAAAATAGVLAKAQTPAPAAAAPAPAAGKFKLKYAPQFGAFSASAGNDPIAQLKFMADQGFRAFFDNGLAGRPAAQGEAIMKEAERLGLSPGPFVASGPGGAPNWVLDTDATRTAAVELVKKAVENAKRLNIPNFLVVPGVMLDRSNAMVGGLTLEQMQANVIKNLKFVVEKVDFAGKSMVLEPLNPRNHHGMFLVRMPQAVEICKAVGSPLIKIVDDLYHQQISEGDLIPNIDKSWDYIGAFHLGDTPGRNEPLTGEINFRNVFKHIFDKGYQGVLCMEHGKSMRGIEGEQKLLAAYRWCDAFDKPIA